MGVWIETDLCGNVPSWKAGHTLRGCVDWNIHLLDRFDCLMSHPSWVCGLKHSNIDDGDDVFGHTLRGCVDWNLLSYWWVSSGRESHPSWVCGLKQVNNVIEMSKEVTPFVGVWIETKDIVEYSAGVCCHTLRGCVDWNSELISDLQCRDSHTLRGCVDWNKRVGV